MKKKFVWEQPPIVASCWRTSNERYVGQVERIHPAGSENIVPETVFRWSVVDTFYDSDEANHFMMWGGYASTLGAAKSVVESKIDGRS